MTIPGVVTELQLLDPQECNHLITTCQPFVKPSKIGPSRDHGWVETESRQSKSVLISPDDSRFTSIQPLIQKTVNAFLAISQRRFRYPTTHVESVQFTEYLETDFYTWHMDASPETPRFSSASLCLSSPCDYKGGDLSFRDILDPDDKKEPIKIKIAQGELLVFPSLLVHSVTPITQGKRYSLVLWAPVPPEDYQQNRNTTDQSEKPVMSQGQDPILF